MMRSFFRAGLSALFVAAAIPAAQAAAPVPPLYNLAATVPLGGAAHWDYMHYHAATGQLFIAHGHTLSVVDTATNKLEGNVTGLDDTHGIAFNPATGLGYTDSSGTQTLSVFNPATLKVEKTLPSLDDTDGMVFDPMTGKIFVAAGDSAALLALNPATDAEMKIPLGGAPEYLAVNGHGQVFVALNDKNEMAAVDARTGQATARWPLPGCEAPTGVAIDPAASRVFTSCQNGKLAVVNTDTGVEVALLPIGKGSDSAAFDTKRHLIFSANSTGTLSVIREVNANRYVALVPVKTRLGARTMAVNEATGDVYLVTATPMGKGVVKHPGFAPRYKFEPGTLTLLVYHPAS
ncbi:MAG: YncE family protein [Proteobacteria bacterium]|nr:YncE family protein [Pseudomonadota bacterium]MBU6425805.1 YncE family protein [Rhodospirillales bacterium]